MVVIIITFVWRSDSGLLQGKPVLKKENGTPGYGVSTYSAPSALDNNGSRQLPSYRYISVCEFGMVIMLRKKNWPFVFYLDFNFIHVQGGVCYASSCFF